MSDDGHSSEGDHSRRSYHNLLERKRRDHIKDSFTGLKEALPSFKAGKGDKPRASRAQILKQTADYINSCRRKDKVDSREIDNLKRENARIEEQIRAIKAATESGDFEAAAPHVEAYFLAQREKEQICPSMPPEDEEDDKQSDDEDDDDDDEESTESEDSNFDDSDDYDSENATDNQIAV